MAAPKRTHAQREEDLAEIARLYVAGRSHREIAEALARQRLYEVTRQTISRDIMALRERWAQTITDFDTALGTELAKIDHLERTYWEAWERSLGETESTYADQTEEKTTVEAVKPDGSVVNLPAAQVKTRAGTRRNPPQAAFSALSGVQWCIDRRIRLLGLDAPTEFVFRRKVEETAKRYGLDADELMEEFERTALAAGANTL